MWEGADFSCEEIEKAEERTRKGSNRYFIRSFSLIATTDATRLETF
jgi:hypothetical protein